MKLANIKKNKLSVILLDKLPGLTFESNATKPSPVSIVIAVECLIIPKVAAQSARQALDYAVGFWISPILWKIFAVNRQGMHLRRIDIVFGTIMNFAVDGDTVIVYQPLTFLYVDQLHTQEF